MPQYVIFRLAAPMASYGDIAVGERRPTADRPSRSAVMGILAAALGIDRHDDAGQASLSDACKVAVRVERTGRLMVDFHTVQTPRSSKQPYATRADELRADRIETILSRREYRTDVLASVAIEVSDTSMRTADEISEALRSPRYVLYLGRRSCPLSLPLAPICIEASNVLEALQAFDEHESPEAREFRRRQWLASKPQRVAAQVGMLPEDRAGARRETRRDLAVSHRRRQFGLREEVVLPIAGVEESVN